MKPERIVICDKCKTVIIDGHCWCDIDIDEEPAGAGYPDLGAESETERNERINGYRRMK